jgi:hypothetical protein
MSSLTFMPSTRQKNYAGVRVGAVDHGFLKPSDHVETISPRSPDTLSVTTVLSVNLTSCPGIHVNLALT